MNQDTTSHIHYSVLATAYLAPIEWYSALYRSGHCVIEQHEHYVKQTYRNRCRILMPDGLQELVVPVEKPVAGNCPVCDIRLSNHGNWRHHHWNALRTAYGKSPFFEYYAHEFHALYHQPCSHLFDFNERLRRLVCSLIDIEPDVEYSSRYIRILPDSGDSTLRDYRNSINPRQTAYAVENFCPRPYYQVFSAPSTFRPNLSIVDLLFNMGPESILYL